MRSIIENPAFRSCISRRLLVVGLVTLLAVASACSDLPEESLGDGSLGTVEVAWGEEIKIRSLYTNGGDLEVFGNASEQSVRFAVEDYGSIHGFDVDLGVGLSDLCTAEGGMITGSMLVAEGDVVGVIGTSCSVAAAEAAPIITGAGMVMISPSNTAPSLTSDMAGNVGENHFPGYYRTAYNDLIQGQSVAHFLAGEGVRTAAVIHDGGPYTMGLADAFTDAFAAIGGTVTGVWEVERGSEDLVPALTEIAAGEPDAMFFPVFWPIGGYLIQQAAGIPGLSETVMATADGLFDERFLNLPESEGTYVSGPDTRFGDNTNQSTGRSAEALRTRLEELGDGSSFGNFWGHSYDATVLLLDAIAAAAHVRSSDRTLVIDRAGIREYLDNLSGFEGVTGVLSCDEFGDCGVPRVIIHHHVDFADMEGTRHSVVYEFQAAR